MYETAPPGEAKAYYDRHWLEEFVVTGKANLASIAQDPALVVSDLVDALVTTSPKLRYMSGTAAKTLFWMLWCAPESWSDRFMRALVNPLPKFPRTRASFGPLPAVGCE